MTEGPLLASREASGSDRGATTLPRRRTALIGRDGLVRELATLVESHPLVTLTGPGGSGKTHAAVEVARRSDWPWARGRYFVDLSAARSPADVVAAFLVGCATTSGPGQSGEEHLVGNLRDRRAALVVDNCEHVIGIAAGIVEAVLGACPGVRVIATSREPLALAGERVVALPPLDTGSASSAALTLFRERALAVDPDLPCDAAALETMVEIARQLDGMPLAIELAAARCRSLAPAQILDHLRERFRLLHTTAQRDVNPRQESLEAAIGWSYYLLEGDLRRAFRWFCACGGPLQPRDRSRDPGHRPDRSRRLPRCPGRPVAADRGPPGGGGTDVPLPRDNTSLRLRAARRDRGDGGGGDGGGMGAPAQQ